MLMRHLHNYLSSAREHTSRLMRGRTGPIAEDFRAPEAGGVALPRAVVPVRAPQRHVASETALFAHTLSWTDVTGRGHLTSPERLSPRSPRSSPDPHPRPSPPALAACRRGRNGPGVPGAAEHMIARHGRSDPASSASTPSTLSTLSTPSIPSIPSTTAATSIPSTTAATYPADGELVVHRRDGDRRRGRRRWHHRGHSQ